MNKPTSMTIKTLLFLVSAVFGFIADPGVASARPDCNACYANYSVSIRNAEWTYNRCQISAKRRYDGCGTNQGCYQQYLSDIANCDSRLMSDYDRADGDFYRCIDWCSPQE